MEKSSILNWFLAWSGRQSWKGKTDACCRWCANNADKGFYVSNHTLRVLELKTGSAPWCCLYKITSSMQSESYPVPRDKARGVISQPARTKQWFIRLNQRWLASHLEADTKLFLAQKRCCIAPQVRGSQSIALFDLRKCDQFPPSVRTALVKCRGISFVAWQLLISLGLLLEGVALNMQFPLRRDWQSTYYSQQCGI